MLKVSPAAIGNRNGFRTVRELPVNDDCVAADDGDGGGATVGSAGSMVREATCNGEGGGAADAEGEGDVADVGGGAKGGAAIVVELRGAAECSVNGGKKESKKESSTPGIQPRPSASR